MTMYNKQELWSQNLILQLQLNHLQQNSSFLFPSPLKGQFKVGLLWHRALS